MWAKLSHAAELAIAVPADSLGTVTTTQRRALFVLARRTRLDAVAGMVSLPTNARIMLAGRLLFANHGTR